MHCRPLRSSAFSAVKRRSCPRTTILTQARTARQRDDHERTQGRRALAARYDRGSGRIPVELSNNDHFGFPTSRVPQFVTATSAQLAAVEVSPGGGALHWEALDVDLSVPGLLLESVGRAQRLSDMARLAGQVTSLANAKASRANGAKGGRPRKASV